MRNTMRITAAALALAVGLSGAAQAENFNIFSASKAQEAANGTSAAPLDQVRYRHGGRYAYRGGYRHHGGINPGAAFAFGTMGLIAGAAAAASYDRCDPYYEYCGRRYARRSYYAPRYYAPRRSYYYYD
jgi:hypothetical protein